MFNRSRTGMWVAGACGDNKALPTTLRRVCGDHKALPTALRRVCGDHTVPAAATPTLMPVRMRTDYSRHSHDARLLTHRMEMRNQR